MGRKRTHGEHDIANVIAKRSRTDQECTVPTLQEYTTTLLHRLLNGEVNIANMIKDARSRLARQPPSPLSYPSHDEFVVLIGVIAQAINNPSQ